MRTTVAAGRLVEVHRTTITKRHLMRLAAQVTADNPIVSDISNGRVKLLNQYGLEGECITDFGGRKGVPVALLRAGEAVVAWGSLAFSSRITRRVSSSTAGKTRMN